MKEERLSRVYINTDGAAQRPEPGAAGGGYVIVSDDLDNENWAPVFGVLPLGRLTNHEAEYEAAIHALAFAADLDAKSVVLRSDSMLLVRQMNGLSAVRAQLLIPLAARMQEQIAHFDEVEFRWIPRNLNKAADLLSKMGLDLSVKILAR